MSKDRILVQCSVLNPIETSYKSKSKDVDLTKVLFRTKLHILGFFL